MFRHVGMGAGMHMQGSLLLSPFMSTQIYIESNFPLLSQEGSEDAFIHIYFNISRMHLSESLIVQRV